MSIFILSLEKLDLHGSNPNIIFVPVTGLFPRKGQLLGSPPTQPNCHFTENNLISFLWMLKLIVLIIQKQVRMKKSNSFHVADTIKVALMAIGFLAFVMLMSYLYWFA